MFTSGFGVDVCVGAGLGVAVSGMGVDVAHPLKRIPIHKAIMGVRFILSPLFYLSDYRRRGLVKHPSDGGYFMVTWNYLLNLRGTILARLSTDFETQSIDEGLDLCRGGGTAIRIPENNCQQEGRRVFFERHPFAGEHHACEAINPDGVMVKTHQLFGLLTGADRNSLIGVHLV
jgi:hypothetical protein